MPIEKLGIEKHMKNYEISKKQVEHDIRKQRDLHLKSIKEHVAGLKYKTHITDMKD